MEIQNAIYLMIATGFVLYACHVANEVFKIQKEERDDS